MRIEYRRLTGQVCRDPLTVNGVKPSETRKLAREALMSFYQDDGTHFWPSRQNPNGNPEVVQIVDDGGAILARYSIADVSLGFRGSRPSLPSNRGLLGPHQAAFRAGRLVHEDQPVM